MRTPVIPASDPEAWVEQLAATLCAERDRAGEFLAAQQKRVEQVEAFVGQQLERLEKELKAERDEAERLRIACDTVTTRLAQTESRLAEAEKRTGESPRGGDHRAAEEELRQRHQAALEELRLAKNKNAELQQQVARARSTAAKLAQQARKPGWLDWEAEKLRILASLEADDDREDEAQQTQRLGIVEVLRITDEVIAAKNSEIQQLKTRLEEQSRDGVAHTLDAASIDQILNNDAVVRAARGRLQRLQEEWGEKLREAEVELAVERAKIARQRAELEEQIRAVQPASSEQPATTDTDRQQAEPSGRGRWLARLGLTAADREPSRHLP